MRCGPMKLKPLVWLSEPVWRLRWLTRIRRLAIAVPALQRWPLLRRLFAWRSRLGRIIGAVFSPLQCWTLRTSVPVPVCVESLGVGDCEQPRLDSIEIGRRYHVLLAIGKASQKVVHF